MAKLPSIEEMGKKVAEEALEYIYMGKTLREWIDVVKQTRWIPCSERLPKAGEYVGDVAKYYLVQNEYGDMLVARYTHSEYWEQIDQLKPCSDRIVAWMELPESYKTESEEV